MSNSIVKQKSYDFALEIVELYQDLHEQGHWDLARQLIRSGTSIGANVEEALAGTSRKDFLAKMSLASKEARESNYWLRLLTDAEILSNDKFKHLLDKSTELCKILTSIVKTGREGKTISKIKKHNNITQNS